MFLILISLRFFGGEGVGENWGEKIMTIFLARRQGGEGDKNLPKNKLIIISPPSSNS